MLSLQGALALYNKASFSLAECKFLGAQLDIFNAEFSRQTREQIQTKWDTLGLTAYYLIDLAFQLIVGAKPIVGTSLEVQQGKARIRQSHDKVWVTFSDKTLLSVEIAAWVNRRVRTSLFGMWSMQLDSLKSQILAKIQAAKADEHIDSPEALNFIIAKASGWNTTNYSYDAAKINAVMSIPGMSVQLTSIYFSDKEKSDAMLAMRDKVNAFLTVRTQLSQHNARAATLRREAYEAYKAQQAVAEQQSTTVIIEDIDLVGPDEEDGGLVDLEESATGTKQDDMAPVNAGPVPDVLTAQTSPQGVPSWMLLGGAALIAWALLKR